MCPGARLVHGLALREVRAPLAGAGTSKTGLELGCQPSSLCLPPTAYTWPAGTRQTQRCCISRRTIPKFRLKHDLRPCFPEGLRAPEAHVAQAASGTLVRE